MQRFAVAFLAVAGTGVFAADTRAETPVFEPMDVFALQWVDNPQVSPDGRHIVFQRMGFDVMKDRKQSSLWTIDADGRNQRPLAASGHAAKWSPDGQRIAFVAKVGSSTQIQMHWTDSGQTTRITDLTQSPGNLSWSPDGRWLAFTMRVPADQAPLATMPKAPKGAEWAAPVKVIDRVIYRIDGGGYVDPGYTHVFVVSANGGAARQITEGKHNFGGLPAWTADGKALIVSANLDADWEYQPRDSELYRVALEDGAMTRLTERKGPDDSPTFSADGRRLAWLGFDDTRHPYQATQIYLGDANARNARSLTADIDLNIDAIAWDGNRGLWVQYDDHGRTRLGWISVDGGRIEERADDLGGTGIGRPYTAATFSASGARAAYTQGTTDGPAELAVVDRSGKPRVLTDLNANLLDHRTLGAMQEISV
jgi:acylaminoacyl-peptidase